MSCYRIKLNAFFRGPKRLEARNIVHFKQSTILVGRVEISWWSRLWKLPPAMQSNTKCQVDSFPLLILENNFQTKNVYRIKDTENRTYNILQNNSASPFCFYATSIILEKAPRERKQQTAKQWKLAKEDYSKRSNSAKRPIEDVQLVGRGPESALCFPEMVETGIMRAHRGFISGTDGSSLFIVPPFDPSEHLWIMIETWLRYELFFPPKQNLLV